MRGRILKSNSSGGAGRQQDDNARAARDEAGSACAGSVFGDHGQLENAPLPPNVQASQELRRQLVADKDGNSILRRAVLKSVPFKIIAALSQLCPEPLLAADRKGRLPLHHACRLPVNEHSTKVLMLLLRAAPKALLHRDEHGRTPLVYLLWYHAPDRTPEIVKMFCCKLPKNFFASLKQSKQDSSEHAQHYPLPDIPQPGHAASAQQQTKVPNNSSIVPDSNHGCLPLHYAVMQGASLGVLKVLLKAYPLSKHLTDRYGRTALHWYLGAAYLQQKEPGRDSEVDTVDAESEQPARPILHVSGEEIDPDEEPWYDHPLNPAVISLLLSSRVARTADAIEGRSPLHWAAHYWACHYFHRNTGTRCARTTSTEESSITVPPTSGAGQFRQQQPTDPLTVASVKIIIDHHIGQLTSRDGLSMTPLMVFLDSTAKLQQKQYNAILNNGEDDVPALEDDRSLASVGHFPLEVTRFDPPMDCIRLLLDSPDTASSYRVAAVEDIRGRLPIHAALEVAANEDIIATLVESYPASLLHTASEIDESDSAGEDEHSSLLMVPLHAAFSRKFIAPLQTPAILRVLLGSYKISKHGTLVDGRLALKMEDALGYYPIHWACRNGASVEVIASMVGAYPKVALQQLPDGNLPIHCLVNHDVLFLTMTSLTSHRKEENEICPKDDDSVASTAVTSRQLQFLDDIREKMRVLIPPLLSDPSKLGVACSRFGLLPLHIAVLFEAAEYPMLLRMLELYPAAANQFTSGDPFVYSCLDLHDIVKLSYQRTKREEEWQQIRELLFSFSPTLESHRHRQELLDRCVHIIVAEVRGQGSFHLLHQRDKNDDLPDIDITQTLSGSLLRDLEQFTREQKGRRTPQDEHNRYVQSAIISSNLDPKGKPTRTASSQTHQNEEKTPTKSSIVQSVYDDDNVELNYALSDTEYDDDDSYFSHEANRDDELVEEGVEVVDDTDSCDNIDDVCSEDEDLNDVCLETRTCSSEALLRVNATSSSALVERRFLDVKNRLMGEEEKKDDEEELGGGCSLEHTLSSDKSRMAAPDQESKLEFAPPPTWLSEVGLRLWAFFAFYRDAKNPSDNYAKQTQDIFDRIEFACVEKLVSLPLPRFASSYFPETPEAGLKRLVFREAANPKCRELIHRTCYFLGRYDFSRNDELDLLLLRNDRSTSVFVRAYEWIFTTEENTEASAPGVSEDTIWRLGEVPPEIGLTFRAFRRPVVIHFTNQQDVYENEVARRAQAGVSAGVALDPKMNIIPISNSFDSTKADDSKDNRMYATDTQDERFRSLKLLKGDCAELNDTIILENYPYALVYPGSCPTTLSEFSGKIGFPPCSIKTVCADVGNALRALHSKGVIHCNVSTDNVLLSKAVNDSTHRCWYLGGMSLAKSVGGAVTLGSITTQGLALFSSGTLPPEMFTKLSRSDVKAYERYWKFAEQAHGVEPELYWNSVKPKVDVSTGETYVVKCNLLSSAGSCEGSVSDDSQLPYSPIMPSFSSDLWGLGLILFRLHAGHPLFPVDSRTGELLSYSEVCQWTEEHAKERVYEDITDNAAQDLILRLLSPREQRERETIESILSHPFFVGESGSSFSVSKRKMEACAHKTLQRRKLAELAEKVFLEERTTYINCWDLRMLERFHHSPSEIVRRLIPDQQWRQGVLPFPCAMVLLPDTIENLTATSRPVAETFGLEYVKFSKAIYFASLVKRFIASRTKIKWNAGDILKELGLSNSEFGDVQSSMSNLAARHIELFRDDPMAVVLKLVQQNIANLLSLFDGSSAYLYAVDEFHCAPVIGSETYPIKTSGEQKNEVLRNGIMFMHLSSLYARGTLKSLFGLSKLVGLPGSPESWTEEARGLSHKLDESAFQIEIELLQDALSDMYSTKHRIAANDLNFLLGFLNDADPEREYAGLIRVSSCDMGLWTTSEGVKDIKRLACDASFRDVLEKIRKGE